MPSALRRRGVRRELARSQAQQILDRLGVGQLAGRKPAQLSGGEQQRVGLARAMARQAALYLFDEPTASLDPELTGDVLNVMRELATTGITMLVVTHEIGFAASVAAKIVFLDHGEVLVEGPPASVFGKPRRPRIDQFLETYLDRGAATLL